MTLGLLSRRVELPAGYYLLVYGEDQVPAEQVEVKLFNPSNFHIPATIPYALSHPTALVYAAVRRHMNFLRGQLVELHKVIAAVGEPTAVQTENNLGQRRLAIRASQDEDSPCPADFEIIDKATTNHDVVATVPLTWDEEYDERVVKPWAELFVKAPELEACLVAVERRLFEADITKQPVPPKEIADLAAMVSVALGTASF